MKTKKILFILLAIVLLGPFTLISCAKGEPGLSAFEIYLKYHPDYTGSEEDWINSIANVNKENQLDKETITASETGLFVFSKNTDGISYTLAAYTGVDKRVDIPSTYRGCPVTIIGDWAFKDNSHIETVYIPNTVTHIEACAFQESSLKSLYIPLSVISIEYQYIAQYLDVYYEGSENQWENILETDWNTGTIHYNHKP